MNKFEKLVQTLTLWTSYIGQVALFSAMAVVVANIILRELWRPIPGTVELTEIFGAILLAMGIAYCALLDGHISVDFLVEKLPPKRRAIVDSITSLIAFVFITVLSGQMINYASSLLSRGAATSHLGIPTFLVAYLVAFGFVMLSLVLLLNLIKKVLIIADKSQKGSETQ